MRRCLCTVAYVVKDLAAAKAWYADVFDVRPYFDEPFYVGFNVGGYELGLAPADDTHQPGPGGTVAYWGVTEIRAADERVRSKGAKVLDAITDVGGGILAASYTDPFGNTLGLIENPHFPNKQ